MEKRSRKVEINLLPFPESSAHTKAELKEMMNNSLKKVHEVAHELITLYKKKPHDLDSGNRRDHSATVKKLNRQRTNAIEYYLDACELYHKHL